MTQARDKKIASDKPRRCMHCGETKRYHERPGLWCKRRYRGDEKPTKFEAW